MSIKSVKSSVALLNMGPELESMENFCMCHHFAEYYPSRSYEDDIINPICKNVDSRKIPENTKNVRVFFIFIYLCVCVAYVHICIFGCMPTHVLRPGQTMASLLLPLSAYSSEVGSLPDPGVFSSRLQANKSL